MIDDLALLVSHALLMLAAVLLLRRPDLDREDAPAPAGATAPSPAPPPAAARPRA